jgi:hypothetical protein
MHDSTLDLFTNPEMPETPEMQHSIDNMADTLWEVMNNHMHADRQDDAIAVCEEFLVDGRDPLDGEYEFVFIPNFTLN